MNHPPLEGLSFNRIAFMVEERLLKDASGRSDARAMLPFVTEEWRQHRPPNEAVGEPCQECGETWPCNSIKFILSYD